MRVYSVIAIVLCVAAAVSGNEVRGPLMDFTCAQALQQLTSIQATITNQHLLNTVTTALNHLQSICHTRGVFDSLAGMFNLGSVWNILTTLQNSASGLWSQFTSVLEQIVFSAGALWDSHIKDILANLVQDLKNHAADVIPIVTSYIPQLTQALAQAGKREIPAAFHRGIFETVSNLFGLDTIWANITSVASDAKNTLIALLGQLMFMGSEAYKQALVIMKELAANLIGHTQNASPLVAGAIAQLQALLAQTAAGVISGGKRDLAAQRGFWDSLASIFGLNTVWATITAVSGQVKDQFFLVLEKLMFAGTTAWANAKPIFSQLVADLTSHAGNAAPLLANAVAQLTAILPSGKRAIPEFDRSLLTKGFVEDYLETVNMSWLPPWFFIFPTVQELSEYLIVLALFHDPEVYYHDLIEEVCFGANMAYDELLEDPFHTDEDVEALIWNWGNIMLEIFPEATTTTTRRATQPHTTTTTTPSPGRRSLHAEERSAEERGILELAENLFGISGIISTVTSLGAAAKDKFLDVVKGLFFAGTQAWAQAKPIFTQLVADLTSHAGNAAPFFNAAMTSLQAVLANAVGKREVALTRGMMDYLESFFGLSGIISNITALGSSLKEQFFGVLTNVFLAGTSAWNNAKPIFSQLVADLQGHANLAVPLFTNAISQLTSMLSNGKRELAAERGFLDFVENMFGISGIISTVTALGSSLKDQFLDIVKAVFFAGTQAWAQATPIFSELVSNLGSHASNALPLVQGAMSELTSMLTNLAASHLGGKRGLFDSIISQITGQFNTISSQISTVLSAVHGQVQEQFLAVMFQVATLAGQAKEAATKIITQLVADLKAHIENAGPLVSAAVQQLAALLPSGKRALPDISNILSSLLGTLNALFPTIELGNFGNEVIALINHVTGPLKDQLMAVIGQMLFLGAGLKDQAIQLIVNAYNQLKNDWTQAPAVIMGLVSSIQALVTQG